MIFFTDIQTHASNYCLLNINKYHQYDKYKEKKLVFIDPGVMELRKATEYKYIDKLHWLAQGHLRPNEYLSIDYPCDMVDPQLPKAEYEARCKLFVEKSVANNWKYAENPQYICAIQYDWMAQKDFEFRMKELEPVYAHKKKIVALGNLCRLFIKPEERKNGGAHEKYMDFVIAYIIRNKAKFYWIHIYGLAAYAIDKYMSLLQYYAPNITISVDSTKWTRPRTRQLHDKYCKPKSQTQLFATKHIHKGYCCSKDTRDEFFLDYMKSLEKKTLKVIY
jgi:hypothetical protein